MATIPTDPEPQRPRRWRRSLATVVVAAVLVVAGVAVGTHLETPGEVAAQTAAPEPTVLTARVTESTLEWVVTTRGTVRYEFAFDVVPEPPSSGQVPVVTATGPGAGATVVDGAVLFELAGRPLLTLQGDAPMFRDIRPGAQGRDVDQLQAGLVRLGLLDADDADGTFGRASQDAVAAWYDGAGYPAQGPSTEEVAALDAAGRTVDEARAAVAAATDDSTRVAALAALDGAEAEHAALAAATGTWVPYAEILFVPVLPATVATTHVGVGSRLDRLDGPSLTLVAGSAVVDVRVPPGDAATVTVGTEARIEGPDGAVDGTVSSIGSPSAATDGEPLTVPVTVTPLGALPANIVGQNLAVDLVLERTPAPVLVVPVAALRREPAGDVVRRAHHGVLDTVVVRAGISDDGFIEVEPLDGTLRAGDEVVVGR